ncbi:hypothetical protein N7519_006142 [Penicillium mononematosum]|uniref:uncharacterized protein n=1 Tax=Penicillium mononematosum TaxID=268346 RepID=UPI002546C033|nr:uncharacterized protein N7519_006142 [Penicillium mononematosum]KAJ6184841.1 hypothetical protein N7519_006142 [Penicillium mononematosum]
MYLGVYLPFPFRFSAQTLPLLGLRKESTINNDGGGAVASPWLRREIHKSNKEIEDEGYEMRTSTTTSSDSSQLEFQSPTYTQQVPETIPYVDVPGWSA